MSFYVCSFVYYFFVLKLFTCIKHSYSEPQHIVHIHKKGYKIKKYVIHNKKYYLNYYDMKKGWNSKKQTYFYFAKLKEIQHK